MKRLIIIFFLLLLLFPTIALAQKFYVGIDHTFIDYSESGGYEADLQMLSMRFGTLVTKNFAIEARLGRGIRSDMIDVMGINVHFRLGNAYGFYALGVLPIADIFKIYVPIGFSGGSATASAPGISITETETDFSYGIGTEIMSGKRASFMVEYMQFIDKPDFKYSGLSGGFKLYF